MPHKPKPKRRPQPKPKARRPGAPRTIRGRGNYEIGPSKGNGVPPASNPGVLARMAAPFLDNTASVGLVNRAARTAGTAIGNWTGIPGAGTALGNAGSWLSRIVGFGDYRIARNSLANEGIVQFKGAESTVISGKEFVTNISGSAGFASRSFIINPGNSSLFPWFSTVALNYENWEPMGIVFEFRTTSAFATGTTNSALGTVIQATDYDVVDAPYTNKQQMLISTFANSQAPCTSFYHPVECASKKNTLGTYYVQAGSLPSDYPDDPRFSALGNFQIATEGMQVTNVVGELWVSYRFRMSKPQLSAASASSSSTGQYSFGGTTAGPMVVVNEVGMHPTLGVTDPGLNSETITVTNLAAGSYQLYSRNQASSTGLTFVTPASSTVTLTGGAVLSNHFSNAAGSITAASQDGSIGTTGIVSPYTAVGMLQVKITSLTDTVTWPQYTWFGQGYRDLFINKIPTYTTLVDKGDFMSQFISNRRFIENVMSQQHGKDEISPGLKRFKDALSEVIYLSRVEAAASIASPLDVDYHKICVSELSKARHHLVGVRRAMDSVGEIIPNNLLLADGTKFNLDTGEPIYFPTPESEEVRKYRLASLQTKFEDELLKSRSSEATANAHMRLDEALEVHNHALAAKRRAEQYSSSSSSSASSSSRPYPSPSSSDDESHFIEVPPTGKSNPVLRSASEKSSK